MEQLVNPTCVAVSDVEGSEPTAPKRQRTASIAETTKMSAAEPPICVMVHGGAWAVPDSIAAACLRACEDAASKAFAVLERGETALDAVEAAVRSMEAAPCLNAGKGCSLNELGDPELDAMIMDGSLQCGAVAGVQVAHPVSLARRVMEDTNHTMLVGIGAMKFASSVPEQSGLVAKEELMTPEALEEWKLWAENYRGAVGSLFAAGGRADAVSAEKASGGEARGDTVGCVALDAAGNVACATSTGGIVGKRQGRVGDSPLIGSGGYADLNVGAVSTTGHGEAITKVNLAHHALWLVESGTPAREAAEQALRKMQQRCGKGGGGCGGMAMITASGDAVASFTTQRMPWALKRRGLEMTSGIDTGCFSCHS